MYGSWQGKRADVNIGEELSDVITEISRRKLHFMSIVVDVNVLSKCVPTLPNKITRQIIACHKLRHSTTFCNCLTRVNS
jgi:hypothetical protein